MDAENLRTIIASNLRLNVKQTLFPAILLLIVIPLIYGTTNLDSIKSADCLERMVALIGLPLFVPLLKPEQNGGMDAIIGLRPFPRWIIAALRIGLSLLCAAALTLAFEGYMRMGGCAFPVGGYTLRTLAAVMTLGFVGLLASALSGNTAVGFLVSFCWYGVLQTDGLGTVFRSVSNGISVYQVLLLLGSSVVIIISNTKSLQKS